MVGNLFAMSFHQFHGSSGVLWRLQNAIHLQAFRGRLKHALLEGPHQYSAIRAPSPRGNCQESRVRRAGTDGPWWLHRKHGPGAWI